MHDEIVCSFIFLLYVGSLNVSDWLGLKPFMVTAFLHPLPLHEQCFLFHLACSSFSWCQFVLSVLCFPTTVTQNLLRSQSYMGWVLLPEVRLTESYIYCPLVWLNSSSIEKYISELSVLLSINLCICSFHCEINFSLFRPSRSHKNCKLRPTIFTNKN